MVVDLSISFSDHDLALIAGALGERVLPPAEKGFAALADEESLIARTVLRRDGDDLLVVTVVAKLVAVLARPLVALRVFTAAPGRPWALTRVGIIPEVAVLHDRVDGRNRLTPVAPRDLLGRVLQLSGIGADVSAGTRQVSLPDAAVRLALADGISAEDALRETLGPSDADLAAPLYAALTGRRVAIEMTSKPAGGAQRGWQFAWAGGPDGGWEIPTVLTPLADGEAESSTLMTLTPMSGQDAVALIRGDEDAA